MGGQVGVGGDKGTERWEGGREGERDRDMGNRERWEGETETGRERGRETDRQTDKG